MQYLTYTVVKLRVVTYVLVMTCVATLVHGQERRYPASNIKMKEFRYSKESQRVDSLSVIALYALVGGDTLWMEDRWIEVKNDSLIFLEKYFARYGDSPCLLSYRILPFRFSGYTYQRLDPNLRQPVISPDYIGFSYNYQAAGWNRQDQGMLNYSGSFSRGLSLGNKQSLVLNSALNLQINGVIGDDIELLAAISDNNIPIQPEGNTQQLQEFDRIFIELRKGRSSLRAGDFEIGYQKGYFKRYFKRSQGVLVKHLKQIGDGKILEAQGSFAISKGKFRRQIIVPVEGNQGPYRLTGNDGETFIIVLANTEKVFLDGELLKRGLELDYVIDYNRGELLFTTRRLITKELRIIVEFEYADQQYLRSMYTANAKLSAKTWHIDFGIFSEQDNKNVLGNQILTDEDKLLLASIGDQIDKAVVSGIRSPSEELAGRSPILYEVVDTILLDGRVFQNILRYSLNPEAERKVATFTDFGEGNGNYIISDNLANGRVFEWISPDPQTGRPRGRFEPVTRIVTPKLQRMMTLSSQWTPEPGHEISAEIALSTFDKNRFSPLDNDDNQGLGFHLGYQGRIHLDTAAKWTLIPVVQYENKNRHFVQINQYRNQEFNRDWNIISDTSVQEHLVNAQIQLQYLDRHMLQYGISGFFQDGLYDGLRHQYDLTNRWNNGQSRVFGSFMRASGQNIVSSFARPRVDVRQKVGKAEVGAYYERERSQRIDAQTSDVLPGSFSWDLGRLKFGTDPSKRWSFNWNLTLRQDQLPDEGRLINASEATELRMEGVWTPNKQSRLVWNLAARDLRVEDTEAFGFTPLRTYLGRVSYTTSGWNNTIRYNTTYEIGSGQEPKLAFVYLEVRPGEGQYIWTDRNGDGVQQLDEFEVAPFADQANFVRVATLTNDFVRTNNLIFNQQIQVDPRIIWHKKQGIQKILSKFSLMSNLNINRKAFADSRLPYWNPFLISIESDELMNAAALSRQSLFFNRAHPKYEVQYNHIRTMNRLLLTSGNEMRSQDENQLSIRWNPGKNWSVVSVYNQFKKFSEAENFNTRNFDIEGREIKQEISYQIQQGLRANSRWRYNRQINLASDLGEKGVITEVVLSSVINQSSAYATRIELSYAKVTFDGERNSALEFAMLEGLQNGNNILWNLQIERTLINNVQLLISYEGRKTGLSSTVHVGRMQLRATF